jgi:DNA-binding response OmpR family regulator
MSQTFSSARRRKKGEDNARCHVVRRGVVPMTGDGAIMIMMQMPLRERNGKSQSVPRRLEAGTRLLLLGLPDGHAATVGRVLRASGAEVDLASHGRHGRRLVRNNSYSVIVLALRAGTVGDLAAVRFCRRHGVNSGILAVVGEPDVTQVVRIIDGGADDCVTSPFHADELLARLCALARRVGRGRPESSVIRTHDLTIDVTQRTVERAGRPITLTAREFGLLQLLAQHRGQAVSRRAVRAHLYGNPDASMSNLVDVYISYLRKKIDRDFALPLILTRWGQGYLLRGDDDASLARSA